MTTPARPISRVVRPLALALLAVLLGTCLLAVSGLAPRLAADYWDFDAYWRAAELMHAGGDGLYEQQETVDDVGPYVYPPPVAVVLGLLVPLGKPAALMVWVGSLFAALAACMLLAWRSWGQCGPRPLLLAGVALVLFGPFFADVLKANVNTQVTACMVAGLFLIERGRQRSGGALLASAAMLKVVPVALLAWLVARRQWRALAGWLLGIVIMVHLPILCTVPALGLGTGIGRGYALNGEFLVAMAGPRLKARDAAGVGGPVHYNASIHAAMSRWFVDGSRIFTFPWPEQPAQGPLLVAVPKPVVDAAAFAVAAAMLSAGLLLAGRRGRDNMERLAGAGLVFVPAMLGNVLCWPNHLMGLALLAVPMAAWAAARNRAALASMLLMIVAATLLFRQELWWFRAWGIQTILLVAAWCAAALALWRRGGASTEGAETGDRLADRQ